MTLGPLALLSVLLVPLLLGTGVLRALGLPARADRLGWLAWSALAGGLGTGALLFAWAWAGAPFDARLLAPCVAALGLLGHALARRRAPRIEPAPARAFPRWERAAFAVVVALALLSTLLRILRGSARALAIGDDATIWGVKAKLLWIAGGFNARFGALSVPYYESHPDYPQLNPLLQVWAHAHAGVLEMVEARFPIQVFTLALVLAQASALRARLRPGLAAALVLVLVAIAPTGEMTRTALADPMVALGLLVAVDGWLRWRGGGGGPWAALSALGLAFAAASKNEGVAYALAFAVAGALDLAWRGARRERRSLAPLAWFLVPLATIAAGVVLNARFGFQNDHAKAGALAILLGRGGERLGDVLAYYGRLFFARPSQNAALWAALLVLWLLAPRRWLAPGMRFPALFLALVLAGWVLIYLCTPHELGWHLVSSAPRLAYHPLSVVAVALALFLARDPFLGRACAARPLGPEERP